MTLAQSTSINNSSVPSIDIASWIRVASILLFIFMLLTATGCSTAQSQLQMIDHNDSCESDVHTTRGNDDNTIIIQDNQVSGYCYIGWDA